jgi:RNA polymerase sigma factor (sigma-70 family)
MSPTPWLAWYFLTFQCKSEIWRLACHDYNKAGWLSPFAGVKSVMTTSRSRKRDLGKRRYMVAVVIGTALTGLGASPAPAATTEVPARAINDINRYCTACWRNARLHPDQWTDCTQEVYSRLLDRVAPTEWSRVLQGDGDERREFFRAIDAVKKRSQRTRKWSSYPEEGVADRDGANNPGLSDDREAVEKASADLLSSRQQQILRMTAEGWSVNDMSEQLQLSAERVSDEKYKAIQKLRRHFNVDAA